MTPRQKEVLRLFHDPPWQRTPTGLVRYHRDISVSAAATACKALNRDGYLKSTGAGAYTLTEKGVAAKKETK